MYECIFVIGQNTADETYSWMISLLDYSRVAAVTIFDFQEERVTLHEAGGQHRLSELEKRVKRIDKEVMSLVLCDYLIDKRPGIYRDIFQDESPAQLPPVALISVSSHSFVNGLSPRYTTPDGAISYTENLLKNTLLAYRDRIRATLSPDCVIKLWGCQGIGGDGLVDRTLRACLQLDWDEKQGNRDFFHPELYSPPPPPLDDPKHDEYRQPKFFEIMRRNREAIDEKLREEFDYLTARNIIKYIFFGDHPGMTVPAEKDTAGTIVQKKKQVEAGFMKNYVSYPVALSRFLDRPVIASSFGLSTEQHDMLPDKLSLLGEIRDKNRAKTFPGLAAYFDKAGGEITMPVKVECVVIDLIITRWVTPRESIQVPPVLLSMDFPSERYVVYRPDISLSNVAYPGRSASSDTPSILKYQGTDEDILETAHLLTYPSIKDYV
jgi:hypothetical protein